MSNSENGTTADGQHGENENTLKRFERNRFFNGKLMTARDMEAEQAYHANRLETLTGRVTGWGIVCGLGVQIETSENEAPRAIVDAGVAIDQAGHIVVVPDGGGDKSFSDAEPPITNSNEVSVFLRYDSCMTESVPAHGSEDACKEECDYNRLRETYEIVINSGGPDQQKSLPFDRVEFPTSEEVQSDVTMESGAIHPDNDTAHLPARYYHESEDGDSQFRSVLSCETPAPGQVFLGHFTADGEDGWRSVDDEDETTEPRPYVYTNDMLYTGLLDHATDFGNPHELSLSVKSTEDRGAKLGIEGDDPTVSVSGQEGTSVTVDGDSLFISGGGGFDELEPLVEYLSEKKLRLDALRKLACAFEDLRDQLEYVPSDADTDTEPPSVLADSIATVTRHGIEDGGNHDAVHEEPDAFTSFIEEQLRSVFKEFLKSLPDFVDGTSVLANVSFELDSTLREVSRDEATGANAVAIELLRFAETASCLSGRCIDFTHFDEYTTVTSPLTLKDVVVDPNLVELPMLWTYVPTVVPVDAEVDRVLEFLDEGLRIELPPTDLAEVTVRNGDGFTLTAFDEERKQIDSDTDDSPNGTPKTLEVSTNRRDRPITYLDLDVEAGQRPSLIRDELWDRLSDEQNARLEESETMTGQLVSICLQ